MSQMIPGVYVTGSFTARTPFDTVVDPETTYTVEALRTVEEIRTSGRDLNALIFEPVGILETEGETLLDALDLAAGVVIILTSYGKEPVYLPSSHLLSFPAVDGVPYQHMAMVCDLGAVPPNMVNVLALTQEEIQDLILNKVGVNAKVNLGVIPTTTYVTAGQARAFENTRRNAIANTPTNAEYVAGLEDKVAKQELYINQLEGKLIAALETITDLQNP